MDLWAAGCVIAELFELYPLCPGATDIEQISCVLQVFGTPTKEEWPGLDSLPDFGKIIFPTFTALPLGSFITSASPLAVDFLQCLLRLDPAKRVSAAKALQHPWFEGACKSDGHDCKASVLALVKGHAGGSKT